MQQNMSEAMRWGEMAAAQGDVNAQAEMGFLHLNDGEAHDEAKALRWFLRAARNGSATSQYRLGLTYTGGLLGCAKDPDAAKYWFSKAALQGDQDAKSAFLTEGQSEAGINQALAEYVEAYESFWWQHLGSSWMAEDDEAAI